MNRPSVALVARANRSRRQLATYLRAGGYDVLECRDLATARSVAGVVVIDSAGARERARAWLRLASSLRIVVISSKPSGWKTLAMAHRDDVYVLAAPAFGWQIVDALRAPATLA